MFRRHRFRTSEEVQYGGLRVSFGRRHSFPPSTEVAVCHNKDMSDSFHVLSYSLFPALHIRRCVVLIIDTVFKKLKIHRHRVYGFTRVCRTLPDY